MLHFLKSLELNGFKSFAQKTVLHFPAGITAIVGPNGSGKSNVVDAIRWLLGERETKNLRGERVEDLIFAGTPEKPRQSLAEASLHFENQGAFFPIEASEISVTRQVTRDGESRYFLNQSEVRLKDLVDFFAKARLGTKGLTVVTQGNSDLFIRATPAERREMLEEMLGLREYQLKKTRAENQLKHTQINLDKVRALIEEILPHLRSLRRQTARWQKRGSLEAELRAAEDQLFGSEWHWLHEAMAQVQKEIDAHHSELAAQEKEKAKARDYLKAVEAKEPEGRRELEAIKAEVSDLVEKQIELEKDLSRLETRLEMAPAVARGFSLSSEKIIGLIQKIRKDLEAHLEKNLDDLKIAIQNLIQEIDAALSPSGSPLKTILNPELENQLLKINHDLSAVKQSIRVLRGREKLLEKNQGEFYTLFKEAVARVEAVKSRVEEWDLRNQKVLFERERLELRIEELKRQIVQMGRRPEEFRKFSSPALLELSLGLDSPELRELERKILKLRGDLAAIGEIDEAVMKEAQGTETRYEFLTRELEDTEKAKSDLKQLIKDLSDKIKTEFNQALHQINREFNGFFRSMFDGGHVKLAFEKKELQTRKEISAEEPASSLDQLESASPLEVEKKEEGIEISLSLPRKRLTSLEVLSGGERSLVGIAALFAMIAVSSPPFLVLDEIDAALDERNARRFATMLKNFSKKSQFIIVTHNRASMEVADVLYGVTLDSDGASKILSLRLEPG